MKFKIRKNLVKNRNKRIIYTQGTGKRSLTIILVGLFGISSWLLLAVFQKSAPNFPVAIRTNDFGSNFLANRFVLWQIPILGLILIALNSILARVLKDSEERLSFFLKSVNIGIAVLILLISVQIYLLNR